MKIQDKSFKYLATALVALTLQFSLQACSVNIPDDTSNSDSEDSDAEETISDDNTSDSTLDETLSEDSDSEDTDSEESDAEMGVADDDSESTFDEASGDYQTTGDINNDGYNECYIAECQGGMHCQQYVDANQELCEGGSVSCLSCVEGCCVE